MDHTQVDQCLGEYDACYALHKAYTDKLRGLLAELLEQEKVHIHSVTSRVKPRDSLAEKLQRPTAHYSSLSEVTDLSGVRITTYFSDGVDKAAELIRREFDLLPEFCVDKRAAIAPDQFGYLSLHYVVQLSKDRSALPEYRRFPHLRCEIQLRSILQHSWAEIEHDLGYKVEGDIPRHIRRRFSRLAGILELADEEFLGIRDSLAEYDRALRRKIQDAPECVGLDLDSLRTLVERDPIARDLDAKICLVTHMEVGEGRRPLDGIATSLEALGLTTIQAVQEALRTDSAAILVFVNVFFERLPPPRLPSIQSLRGICLVYLWYYRLGQLGRPEALKPHLRMFKEGSSEMANRILAAHASVLARGGPPVEHMMNRPLNEQRPDEG